jgi:hypothetical protein
MVDAKGKDQEAAPKKPKAEAVKPEPVEPKAVEPEAVEPEVPEGPEPQSHSAYLPGFVSLEGAAISDHPGAAFEYHKSLRDVAKQQASNEGGRSFDAGGEEAEDRLQEKLGLLAEEDVFARTYPGSGGYDTEESAAAQKAQAAENAKAVKEADKANAAVAEAARAARDGDDA